MGNIGEEGDRRRVSEGLNQKKRWPFCRGKVKESGRSIKQHNVKELGKKKKFQSEQERRKHGCSGVLTTNVPRDSQVRREGSMGGLKLPALNPASPTLKGGKKN